MTETIHDLIRFNREPTESQPIGWNRKIWQKLWDDEPAIPAVEALDLIDAEVRGAGNGTMRRSWIRSLADGDALVVLAASTIWGYGNYVRFGRPALKAMLGTPGAAAIVGDIVEQSRRSPAAGFSALFADGSPRISRLGIAFGTKVVHFAGYDFATPKPLILDKRVFRSAQRLGIGQVPDPERFATGEQYQGYCDWAAQVAATHGVEPEAVEYALFAAGGDR
ncbi:MAG: hypothetical protein WBA45_14835 [Microthrixaceae bacterium]